MSNKIVFHPLFFVTLISLLIFWACSKPTKHHFDPQPPEETNCSDGYPSYSPDGRYLAYDHHALDTDQMFRFGSFSIWVYDLQLRRYGFLVGPGMFPRWSPDGSIVAFNWGHEIFFYYMATGTVKQVTELGREIYIFRFTPDGTRLCATYTDILLIDTSGNVSKIIYPYDGENVGWGGGADANWSTSEESLLVTGSFTRGIWGAVLIDSFGLLLNSILVPQSEGEEISFICWSSHRYRFAADYLTTADDHLYSDLRIYRMDGTLERIIAEDGGWKGVSLLLIFGHFVAPFFLLLPYASKRNFRLLAIIAGWMLLMHWVDLYWVAMPAKPPRSGNILTWSTGYFDSGLL